MATQAPARDIVTPRPAAQPPTLGVFGPSGRVDPALLAAASARFAARGWPVRLAPETSQPWRYFAGTDAQRLSGLSQILADPDVDIAMAARGGYGLSRLLDRINWEAVRASRKVFVGFSDFTAFNCAAHARAGLVTLHGPMLTGDFGEGEPDAFMWQHFEATLHGERDSVTVEGATPARAGNIAGTLWGGNLSMLAHLAGTPYLPDIRGGLLYLEEIDEQPYAIERMLLQLQHAGVLDRQRALLLGDFRRCDPTNTSRYPYSLAEALESIRERLPIPVLEGLPFGHVARKLTLPFGLEGELAIGDGRWQLSWAGLGRR